MSDYDNCNTLEEAIAVWQELDPWSERTNSGKAESIILQAVKDKKLVPAVVGRWVGIDDYPHETWECSKCGRIVEHEYCSLPNYCDECGADMREHEN